MTNVSSCSSPSALIVRLDAIGDALTTVPLIAALRGHGLRVGAVLRAVNAGAFSQRALDRIHLADDPDPIGGIRAARYDYALIATEKPLAYRIARDSRIPVRIGFQNGRGKPLKSLWVRSMCTQTIFRTAGLDPNAPHECEVLCELARGIVPNATATRDASVLRPLVIDEEPVLDGRIAMQITQKWQQLGAPMTQVAELAQRISRQCPLRLIGAASEQDYCNEFGAAAGMPVETFVDLAPWKTAIAASRALVAPDSGATHVAGMTGTPVIACFAAVNFELQSRRWAPWAAPSASVRIEGALWPVHVIDAVK